MNAVTICDEQPNGCGCFKSDDQCDALRALARSEAPRTGRPSCAPAFGAL